MVDPFILGLQLGKFHFRAMGAPVAGLKNCGQAATAVAVHGNAVTKRQQGEGKALHWGPDHPSDEN